MDITPPTFTPTSSVGAAALDLRAATEGEDIERIERHLGELMGRLGEEYFCTTTPKRDDTSNFWANAVMSDEDREIHARTQSKHIKMGGFIEAFAVAVIPATNHLVLLEGINGPGLEACATTKPRGNRKRYKTGNRQFAVTSCLPERLLSEAAQRILTPFIERPAGERTWKALRDLIDAERQVLAALPHNEHDTAPTQYLVDLGVAEVDGAGDPRRIYLIEMKTSGRLDSKNITDELFRLIKAALAIGAASDCEVMPVIACAFTDEQAGRALLRAFPAQCVWAGEGLWGRLLPAAVTFPRFKQILQMALAPYRN